jgi:hypothetical protein
LTPNCYNISTISVGDEKSVNCSVCKRETSPIKIGGKDYCSVCGNPYVSVPTPAATVNMDIARPRPGTPPASAAAMHNRVKPAHLLDLRATTATAPATPHAPAAPTEPHHTDKPGVVHATHHTPAAPPKTAARDRHIAQFTDRFDRAKQYDRSPHINKFANQFGDPSLAAITTPESKAAPTAAPAPTPHHQPPAAPTSAPVPGPASELPRLAATHHEAMSRLAPQAPAAPAAPMNKTSAKPVWRPHLSLSPGSSRTLATAAAITIMGGYIWLQNYPKLAIQAAGNQAGLTASLPGYMPSSYNLASTDVIPGRVTLSYGSASASEALKIAQVRTSWDSSSLLDNFVAKNTDDYSTIQGQGLTIYIWGNNHATWINHGIWYSIEGATRLSREQILKIAFSL